MNKSVTLIACCFFLLLRNLAFAQNTAKTAEDKESKKDEKTFIIESLDGKNQTIHIVPDYFHHRLRISCLKDTIADYDFCGVPVAARILNKEFILQESRTQIMKSLTRKL